MEVGVSYSWLLLSRCSNGLHILGRKLCFLLALALRGVVRNIRKLFYLHFLLFPYWKMF